MSESIPLQPEAPLPPRKASPTPAPREPIPTTRTSTARHGEPPRRGFFVKFAAACLGLVLVVVPFAAGVLVLLDPLRRKAARGQFIRVAPLEAVPDDGRPRQFPVVVERRDDAWNRYHEVPVGAVWLCRLEGRDQVEAFNVVCPHLGCSIGYAADRNEFACPCHTSAFALDGRTLSGPSPRGMDTLECRVDQQNGRSEVWVRFENFYTGRAEKVAKA